MESKVTWPEVQTFCRIREDGTIWEKDGNYYYVLEEGTVFSWLAVYDLPLDLYRMLEEGSRPESDIIYKLRYGAWPTAIGRCANPLSLIAQPDLQRHYTEEELKSILPIAEEQWLYWRGKLPKDYRRYKG